MNRRNLQFALLALLFVGPAVLLAAGYVLSLRAMNAVTAKHDVVVAPVSVAVPTPEVLARGGYLVHAVMACGDCHARDLGGATFMDNGFMGTWAAPNLTPWEGSSVAGYSPIDWVRAVRHGVDRAGTGLIFMPNTRFAGIGDDDLAAVVAYLQGLPPVERPLGPQELGLGYQMVLGMGGGALDATTLDHTALGGPGVAAGKTVDYGAYLAGLAGCHDCHGDALEGGGSPPGTPKPPAIHAAALESWTLDGFRAAVTRGERADGTRIDPYMPWSYYAGLTDDDVEALWLYARSVEGPS